MNILKINSRSSNSQIFYNTISTILRIGISFFTIPIFTRLLGSDQYGEYSIYLSWYNVLSCFISLGCGQGIATGMIKYKNDYTRFRSSILLGGTIMCGITTFLGIMVFCIAKKYIDYPFIVYCALFLESSSAFVIGFAGNAWTYEKKASSNMLLSLLVLFFTTMLSLVLIKTWKQGRDSLYIARIMGVAVPSILISVVVWIIIFFKKPTGYIKEYWIYSFSFGLPTIFHTLSHQVLTSSDRVMMESFKISKSEIGIYSFFYTFVAILSSLLTALNNSWVPFLYEDLEKKNYSVINRKIKNYCQIFTSLVCGFLMLSREVSRIFASEEYWKGVDVIPIIVIVVYFTFVYQFPVNFEFYKSKPRIIAYGTSFAAVVNIALNAIMIPLWGMYGAAIATLVSYSLLAVVHFIVVLNWKEEKYMLIKYPLFIGLGLVIIACILFYLLADFWVLRWFIGILIGVALIGSVIKRKTIF